MTTELRETLRESGLVAASVFEELERTAAQQGKSLVLALSEREEVAQEALALLVARHHGLPFAHLQPGRVEPGVFSVLDGPEWHRIRALPIAVSDASVTVASADPAILGDARKALEERQLAVHVVVAPEAEIAAELDSVILP